MRSSSWKTCTMMSPKSSRTHRPSWRPSRRSGLVPASIILSSISLAIATTLRSLRPVTSRKTSVSGSGPETSRATRSSPCLESAAAAAILTRSRACSDAVTGSLGGLKSCFASQLAAGEGEDEEPDQANTESGRNDDDGREHPVALWLLGLNDAAGRGVAADRPDGAHRGGVGRGDLAVERVILIVGVVDAVGMRARRAEAAGQVD